MMEGHMVYHNMLYIIEYLPILASKLNLGHICDPNSITISKGSTSLGNVDRGR